ncbi:MAG TPA: PDZ domain-containing protein [Miltoncostaeaceae bacterium]|nr:PDZ domain-containing protein [Miltoncostaeaceae bacterium]
MLRLVTAAALAAAALAGTAAVAVAQQTAPTSPTTPTAPTAPTAPAAAPALDSLRLPRVVSAQQGHARFLVGVRLSTAAKLTVQVVRARDGKIVQTATDASARREGRAYLRIEGVDDSGFQLLQGPYRLRIQAADAGGRTSRPLEAPFRLRLTPPRGLFDAYTVPLLPTFRRQVGIDTPGQLVAVIGPKGTVAAAGIRRGDVITAIDGRSVATSGGWSAAVRALAANKPATVDFVRRGRPTSVQVTPKPDWEKPPDYATSLSVAVRRAPGDMAYAFAQARQLIESDKLVDAQELIDGWRASWRDSAAGQLLEGDLLAKRVRWKQALGAYNRARARDATLAEAELGRGIALSKLGKHRPSLVAFTAAARLDPADPAAAGFRAYALLREDRVADAVAAGQTAVTLDPRYADAFLPLGIALLAAGDRANGVKALRRGLVLLEEPDRADRLIRAHLQRADP